MAFLTPGDDIAMQSALEENTSRGRQGHLMMLAGRIDLDSFVSVRSTLVFC